MKKKYTIVTVISMLIGVADFIFLGCVSDEFFSENAAFVIFIFLAVLLLLIAILKTTEKKYYNDAECWKPEKIKLPELNGALFEDFFNEFADDTIYMRCLSEEYGCGLVSMNIYDNGWRDPQYFDL